VEGKRCATEEKKKKEREKREKITVGVSSRVVFLLGQKLIQIVSMRLEVLF